ncbi:hypothetical protein KFL_006910040 [Klebsormidium nitens]|uniref:MBD domain-containing protein n=1 Tax=Klebsormidium nitens TaxID=105231 RepID=A0A1Y1IIZ1_KLENI|nr:hypothetical protein KFL_006910040 [Klebsormidium nitens]|eukprot:GAQ90840.1 hypothetical protein KFL_006910040 [Klebsormidium nitens]
MVEAAGLWPVAAHDGREHGGRAGAAFLPGQARSSPAWIVGREGRAASGGAGSKAEGPENGSDVGEEAAGWVDYSAQNEEAVDGAEPLESQDAHQRPAARPGDARVAPGVSCVDLTSPPGHHAEAPLLSDEERPGAGPHGAHSPAGGKRPQAQADTSAPNKRAEATAAQEWGSGNGPTLATNAAGTGMEDGQAAEEANGAGRLPAEEEPKESGRGESDVTGVGEGEGEGEVLASAADDEAGSAEQLAEPVEGLRRLAASATLKAAPREGGGQTSALSSSDILQCGGVARWEALLANIAAGEIQLNPETGSYEHRKVVKIEEQSMPAVTYGNGRAQEKPRERRQAPERAPPGRRRRSDPEAGALVTSKEGSTGAPKLAALVDDFVQKLEALFEQDLTAEMQRRASRCTPSTLGAKVSRLAGHPNAGRGPASGYMDESAKNSAALREAAEPIIKALLFRGHYGSTTLAASMAGPLFYPANAAGPELLAALREACQGAAPVAGRAGPMARLLLDLQDGARPALSGDGSPEEQDARVQAWGAAVRGCCGAAVEVLEAVDFFKLCCAEAAATAQEEAAGVMLTAKRSKRAILSSRQAAGSKSKWEHLEDSVAPLAQIVAQRYVAAALHGGEGFSGLHARLQALRGDLLRAGANLEQWRNPPPPPPLPPDHAAADPARLIQAIAGVAGAAGAAPSLAVADGVVGAVVREYAWADPGKWGLLWQQQGAACNGPQARVDGEGRHVYQWAVGKKVWHCYTRMQVRETQEEEGATPLPPRIQLSTTPRPAQPTPKPALPTPRLPAPRPPPLIAKAPSRNSSPRPPSPSPPPAPRPPSAAASKRPRPGTASPSEEAPVVFSFEGPPPGCRLTPAQEAEVMEVVRAQGWEIRQEVRKHGISAGQVDKYYMPPNGDKRLTSLRKVWEYLHFGKGASGRTARDRSAAGASTSDQADFDAARGGVAALLAAQAEVAAEDAADGAAEAGEDDEWAALGVGQGFGVAAAERVKRRRRKPGGTPGAAPRRAPPPPRAGTKQPATIRREVHRPHRRERQKQDADGPPHAVSRPAM